MIHLHLCTHRQSLRASGRYGGVRGFIHLAQAWSEGAVAFHPVGARADMLVGSSCIGMCVLDDRPSVWRNKTISTLTAFWRTWGPQTRAAFDAQRAAVKLRDDAATAGYTGAPLSAWSGPPEVRTRARRGGA